MGRMVRTRRVFEGLLVALLLGLAAPFAAPDDPAPAAPATREVWTFERGEGAVPDRVQVDVTEMPAALRDATKARFSAEGYRFKGAGTALTPAPTPPAPQSDASPPPPRPLPPRSGVRLRIPPLGDAPLPLPFARDGKLQSAALGIVTKTMGRLILKYLEDKKDPVKAEVYEDFLRALAEGFVAADPERPAANRDALAKAVGTLVMAMTDPKKRAAAAEILKSLSKDVAGDVKRAAKEALPVPPPGDVREEWAGARLSAGTGEDGTPVWNVEEVAPDSPAAHAGLVKGDAIVAVDSKTPSTGVWSKLRKTAENGGKVTLTVLRAGGKRVSFDVELVSPWAR